MTGKGFRPRQIDLGPWRWVAAAVFIVYFALIVVLPFAVLLWSSLQKFYSVPSWQALQNLTLDPYRFVLTYPNLGRSVWNSLLLSFGSATLIMLITSVICWIVVKTKLPGRWLLDNLASMPMVFPGLVLGLGYIFFFNEPSNPLNPLYQTMTMLTLCTIVHFYTTGHLTAVTALKALDSEFEAVAASMKVPFWTTLRRVTLPLCTPTLIDIARYFFVNAMTTISAVVFLYSPDTKVASIAILNLDEAGEIGAAAACATMIVAASAVATTAFWLLARLVERRTQAWKRGT
jgi:iron(III) transport system permease protein